MNDAAPRGAFPDGPHAADAPEDAVIITADDPTDLAVLTELLDGLRGVHAEIVEIPSAPGTLGGREVLQVLGESAPLAMFLSAWLKSKVTRLKITVRGTTIDLRSTEADELLPKLEALLAAAAASAQPAPDPGEIAAQARPAVGPSAEPPSGGADVGA